LRDIGRTPVTDQLPLSLPPHGRHA
jgi:hypothetical protein